jgi:YHS domain-containing protein
MLYIDPVCLKKLKKKQEFAIIKKQDDSYHLYCPACKALFEQNPDFYITKVKKLAKQ